MKTEYQIPKDTIEIEAAIDITAPPEDIANLYRDVEKWWETFPAIIDHALVIKPGENWKEIEVAHRQEGCVPNTLFDLSATKIGLKGSKHKFNASFVNRFEPTPDSRTHHIVHAYASPKEICWLLKPFHT